MRNLFYRPAPHGWEPKAGDRVAFCWGSTPGGTVCSVETVADIFSEPHWSGNVIRGYVLECGTRCGRNSLRPLPGGKP